MLHAIRKLYRPEFYQGPDRLAPYFEGWYFKLVGRGRAFALIPGVSRSPGDPHSFIQLIEGTSGVSHYYRFPLESFAAARDRFEVTVGGCRFSLDGIDVRLDGIQVALDFGRLVRWRGTLLQPGTMGWYSFVPFMECKHAIIVMDGDARGEVDGSPWSGALYVEKDYGRSFPNAWVWLQSNDFGTDRVSVSCSIANVPFIGGAFTGFLAGISVDGTVAKFTTYTGCRIETLAVAQHEVSIVLAGRDSRLAIRASREQGAELRSPRDGDMVGRIVETIASSLDVEYSVNGSLVYSGRGSNAGLEVVNDPLLRPRRR